MVEELYAWVGKSIGIGDPERRGEWGLIAAMIPGIPNITPLVAVKKKNALRVKSLAETSIGHTEIQLVRFTKAEVIEKL